MITKIAAGALYLVTAPILGVVIPITAKSESPKNKKTSGAKLSFDFMMAITIVNKIERIKIIFSKVASNRIGLLKLK